jgi:hypothetical protein
MKPTQLNMTELLEKLAPMIHRLLMKCIPQQQSMMNQPMFNPHQQTDYHQPPMTFNLPQTSQLITTTFTSSPRTKSQANIHELQITPDTSPAGKKLRPADGNDTNMNNVTTTQLDDQFAATADTSPNGMPTDLQ